MPVYENKDSYLFVEANEPDSLDLLLAIVQDIADRCQKENLRKVIVDLTQMEGNPGILERYTIGVEVHRICGGRETWRNQPYGGKRRGAKLKVVSTRDAALHGQNWKQAQPV